MVSRFLANPNIDTSLNNNYFLKKISSCTTIRKWNLASKPWETFVTSYLLNKETQTNKQQVSGKKEKKKGSGATFCLIMNTDLAIKF